MTCMNDKLIVSKTFVIINLAYIFMGCIMNEEKNVVEFYVLCNGLKNVIRTGWKDWGVERERVESIAEHVYGVQSLAMVMWSEYKYDIDISKVLSMLAIHELEETLIGDFTLFQIDEKSKQELGHKAIMSILSKLNRGRDLHDLIIEFDQRQTPEAKFAFQCDKLECDIQSRLYDEEHCVDLDKQRGNPTAQSPLVKPLLDAGMSFSEMWLTFGQRRYNYDKNFLAVSDYVKTHKISIDVASQDDEMENE